MRLVPLKRLVRINEQALPEDCAPDREFRYLDIATVGRGVLVAKPQRLTFENAPSRARRLVRAGDCILSTVRTYLRAVWPVEHPTDDLVVSTGFAVLTPGPDMDPRFLGWLAQSDVVVDEVVARSVGVSYPAINASDVGEVRVPCPPLPSQRAIADFLDAETARIDALITKKRQLVQLAHARLWQLARALTGTAGTEVPIRRFVDKIKTGATPPAGELAQLLGGDVPWLSPGDVAEMTSLRPPARSLEVRAIQDGWVPMFPADSTLVVGIGATAGRVAHLAMPSSGNQQMTCIKSRPGLRARFLSWFLWSRQADLRSIAPYTTLPILSNDFLLSLTIAIPSLTIQRDSVAQIDREASRVRALDSRMNRQVDLLRERRQALITAAVTGELPIPGLAA